LTPNGSPMRIGGGASPLPWIELFVIARSLVDHLGMELNEPYKAYKVVLGDYSHFYALICLIWFKITCGSFYGIDDLPVWSPFFG
jgi:predicted secreted protein